MKKWIAIDWSIFVELKIWAGPFIFDCMQRALTSHTSMFVVALLFCVALASASTLIGCYTDGVKPMQRALPHAQHIDTAHMSVNVCLAFCSARGFAYAGVEYGSECYCGRVTPKSTLLDSSKCNMPCAGDQSQQCGGSLAISVHHQPGETVSCLCVTHASTIIFNNQTSLLPPFIVLHMYTSKVARLLAADHLWPCDHVATPRCFRCPRSPR